MYRTKSIEIEIYSNDLYAVQFAKLLNTPMIKADPCNLSYYIFLYNINTYSCIIIMQCTVLCILDCGMHMEELWIVDAIIHVIAH